ncbi:hypothetical protein ACOMHN_039793 [Nucella lapillus]
MKRQLWLGAVLVVVLASVASHGLNVSLSRVSTVYLPTYGEDGSLSYSFPTETVEQLAYHAKSKTLYGVGVGVIHVIDASDVSNMTLKAHVMLADLELTDVEVCSDAVFVTYTNNTDKQKGGVRVYKAYDDQSAQLKLLQDIPLPSLPDMVYPTPNCTLVVAIENEGFVQGGQFYDPPGRVGIVRFPSGVTAQPEVKILDFTKFDSRFEELSASGVRWVYRGSGNNFSNNVEPEYVAFNKDYTKAFICLQENNAIAVVDLETDNITGIYGLGFKSWGQLDPSDKDGGVRIGEWPVYGMYQPDSIDRVHWNGQDYLLTANEGDAQHYDSPVDFDEEIRGKDIEESDFAANVSEDLKQALRNNSRLGRLTLSKVDGKNKEGKFEKFYTYGGRSFSIWRTSDMVQVYDSGSDMEKETAQRRPDIFNSNVKKGDLLQETMDTRSDNKGPETESVTTGELADHLLIFAGNERPGTIAVYSVAPGGMHPQFQSLFSEGIPPGNDNRTWGQLYDARQLYGIDVEFIKFMPVSSGFADFPALLIVGTVSGTVSVLKVDVTKSTGPSSAATPVVSHDAVVRTYLLASCLLSMVLSRWTLWSR